MPANFRCFSCNQLLAAPADARIRVAYCPNCKAKMVIPGSVDEQPEPLAADLERAETHLTERLAYARERNNLALSMARQLADVFPWLQIACAGDEATCPFCRGRDGTLLPTANCTPAQIPPYRQCTCKPHGCRCLIVPIDRSHPAAPPAS